LKEIKAFLSLTKTTLALSGLGFAPAFKLEAIAPAKGVMAATLRKLRRVITFFIIFPP
jgi:hypothetical protein